MTTTDLSATHLSFLRGSLWLALLAGPFVLAAQVVSWARGGAFVWDADIGSYGSSAIAADRGLRFADDAHGAFDGDMSITLEDPGTAIWALGLVPTAILAATVSLVAWWLLGIMRSTAAGEPFIATSVRNLRRASYAVGVAAILVPLAQALVNSAVVQAAFPDADASFYLDLSDTFVWLLVAAVLRVVAEAFRIGADLRRDTEGLV